MVFDDRIIIDDWYVDEEFDNENIKMLEDIKVYIDDLIKKTVQNKKIDIPFETIEQDPVDEKPPPPY